MVDPLRGGRCRAHDEHREAGENRACTHRTPPAGDLTAVGSERMRRDSSLRLETGSVRMPSGARVFGAVERVSTSGCVTTPTTLPDRSMKVRMRESSREPRRAVLANAVGVDCLLSRLICRLIIDMECERPQRR
jgi:hypothetical protein